MVAAGDPRRRRNPPDSEGSGRERAARRHIVAERADSPRARQAGIPAVEAVHGREGGRHVHSEGEGAAAEGSAEAQG